VSRLRGPLRGRVVLVLGAGDRAGQAAALHLSALGAALLFAGPELGAIVTTAGLIAAAGGTVRVVEEACPPLPIADAHRLASEALEPPSDAVVSAASFTSAAAAKTAFDTLRAHLPAGATVVLLGDVPAGDERAAAQEVAAAFTKASPDAPDAGGPSALA
jgi:NAD(P)-dependent dehydrogenase (short-subunit alcohol dehydrogenase family)